MQIRERYPRVNAVSIPPGYLPPGKLADILRGMDKFERRRLRLLKLRDERCGGSGAEVARRIGREPSYVTRMLYPEGKAGKKRIADDMMEIIEKAFELPRGWMDETEYATAEKPDLVNVAPTPMGAKRIPLISYVQAGHMTEAVDSYAVGAGADWILTDLELSPTAFALKIKGDSMLPEFREGDTVIIDPHVQPLPGDFVVAKNGDHEATFKKYRPRGVNEGGETVFELVPLNDDYASMRSDITPVRIIGTMVEHRRYRTR